MNDAVVSKFFTGIVSVREILPGPSASSCRLGHSSARFQRLSLFLDRRLFVGPPQFELLEKPVL